MKFWLSQPKILTNFIAMSFIWLIASFNFYLIQFLLTSFEQVYLSTIFSCISDMLGYGTGGAIFAAIGVKKTQVSGFSIATIGGLIILFYGLKHEGSYGFLFLIMLAKYGTTLSFGLNYSANSYLFPTLFAATALGQCQTFARLFSALSPVFAQMDEPIPMILFSASSAITIVIVMLLNVPKSTPDELITKPLHGTNSFIGVEAVDKTDRLT